MTRIPRKSCLHPYAGRWGQVLSMNNGSVCSQALILPEHSHFGPLAHFSCFLFLSLGSSETQLLLPMLDFSQGLLICTLYNHCPKLAPCHIKKWLSRNWSQTDELKCVLSCWGKHILFLCSEKNKNTYVLSWAVGSVGKSICSASMRTWVRIPSTTLKTSIGCACLQSQYWGKT